MDAVVSALKKSVEICMICVHPRSILPVKKCNSRS